MFSLNQVHKDTSYAEKLNKHLENPEKYNAPKVYKSRKRQLGASHVGTDTDSTPEKERVGGLGKYSHGTYAHVHQHWAMQAEIAGGFNVHDTEAAESFHKHCMVLPATRVRHQGDDNATYQGMQKYLLNNFLFETLRKAVSCVQENPTRRQFESGVSLFLHRMIGSHRTLGT